MNKTFYWIIGGVAAYYILTRTLLAKKLNFLFNGVKFRGKGLNINIDLQFLVQNPANVGATIKSIVGNLYFNERLIGNVTSFTEQKIGAKQESAVVVTIRPQAMGVIQLIKDIFNNKVETEAKFVGNANVDGVILPINEVYKF